ncbi:hypothetical protein BRADI_1g53476v3 [Brachypodium distachyon]|uniref:Uncharacterized protein n=1 Tax=Brachypodium distachyon TaxID=15368 RepID=A0A0Q3S536_BRADI|nr:hypothetical protein BRADI_1g53476v3 [Brachypodium distachyon]
MPQPPLAGDWCLPNQPPNLSASPDAKGALKRNRASPAAIVKLYDDLTEDKKTVIRGMFLGSFLDIKCEVLHNYLVDYVARSYDSSSRSFVFPGRGVLPLTAQSVHEVLGAPNGPDDVPYHEDHALEDELVPNLFGIGNSRPKVSDVAKAIIACEVADDRFKRLWLIYVVSTCLAPTTDTKISNKCYPMLAYINRMGDLNLCKFVADQLHMHFSENKFRKGCLLYCMTRTEAAKMVTKFSIGLNNMLSELVQGLTGLVPSALKRHGTHGKRRINSGDDTDDSSDEDGDDPDSSDDNDADKFKLARRPVMKGKGTSAPASSPGVVLSQINLPSDSEGQGDELSPAQDDPPEHDDRTDEEDGEMIRETASSLSNVLSHV